MIIQRLSKILNAKKTVFKAEDQTCAGTVTSTTCTIISMNTSSVASFNRLIEATRMKK